MSTFTAIHVLWIMSRKRTLPKYTKIAMNAMMGVATIQVSLGIATLLCFVPVPLAAAHQAGSLTLLSVAVCLIHTLRALPK
jgi:cytochrome c oxidase assembly protein subunit 15